MIHLKQHELPGLGRRIIVSTGAAIILALVVAIPIVLFIPSHPAPAIELELVGLSDGVEGQTLSTIVEESPETVVLVNSTILSRSPGWTSYGHSFTYSPIENAQAYFEESQTEIGSTLYLQQCVLSFSRQMILPFRDYTLANYSFDIEIIDTDSTPVQVECWLDFFEGSTFLEQVKTMTKNDLATITFEVPLDHLKAELSDIWCVTVNLRIEIKTASYALVRLSPLIGIAHSEVPLSALVLDMQTLNGNSISNPLQFNYYYYIAVNLTRNDGMNQSALLFPNISNETIYVKVGNYSSISGLYSWHLDDLNGTQLNFELHVNEKMTLMCRIPVIRIHLDIVQAFIIDELYISWDPEEDDYQKYYHVSSLVTPYPEFLYVASPNKSLRISLRYTAGFIGAWFRNILSVEANTTGSNDMVLHVTLPYFSILGVNLALGELFVIIFLLGLIFGIILQSQQPSTPRSRIRILQDPRFFAVLPLCVSIIVPWFSYFDILGQYSYSTLYASVERIDIMLPLSIMIRSSPGIPGQPIYENYIWLEIPTLFFLFWLPLRFVLSRIGEKVQPHFDMWFLICILSPALIGLCYLLVVPYQLTIQLGMMCAWAAPIIYVVGVLISRFRKTYT